MIAVHERSACWVLPGIWYLVRVRVVYTSSLKGYLLLTLYSYGYVYVQPACGYYCSAVSPKNSSFWPMQVRDVQQSLCMLYLLLPKSYRMVQGYIQAVGPFRLRTYPAGTMSAIFEVETGSERGQSYSRCASCCCVLNTVRQL